MFLNIVLIIYLMRLSAQIAQVLWLRVKITTQNVLCRQSNAKKHFIKIETLPRIWEDDIMSLIIVNLLNTKFSISIDEQTPLFYCI